MLHTVVACVTRFGYTFCGSPRTPHACRYGCTRLHRTTLRFGSGSAVGLHWLPVTFCVTRLRLRFVYILFTCRAVRVYVLHGYARWLRLHTVATFYGLRSRFYTTYGSHTRLPTRCRSVACVCTVGLRFTRRFAFAAVWLPFAARFGCGYGWLHFARSGCVRLRLQFTRLVTFALLWILPVQLIQFWMRFTVYGYYGCRTGSVAPHVLPHAFTLRLVSRTAFTHCGYGFAVAVYRFGYTPFTVYARFGWFCHTHLLHTRLFVAIRTTGLRTYRSGLVYTRVWLVCGCVCYTHTRSRLRLVLLCLVLPASSLPFWFTFCYCWILDSHALHYTAVATATRTYVLYTTGSLSLSRLDLPAAVFVFAFVLLFSRGSYLASFRCTPPAVFLACLRTMVGYGSHFTFSHTATFSATATLYRGSLSSRSRTPHRCYTPIVAARFLVRTRALLVWLHMHYYWFIRFRFTRLHHFPCRTCGYGYLYASLDRCHSLLGSTTLRVYLHTCLLSHALPLLHAHCTRTATEFCHLLFSPPTFSFGCALPFRAPLTATRACHHATVLVLPFLPAGSVCIWFLLPRFYLLVLCRTTHRTCVLPLHFRFYHCLRFLCLHTVLTVLLPGLQFFLTCVPAVAGSHCTHYSHCYFWFLRVIVPLTPLSSLLFYGYWIRSPHILPAVALFLAP